MITLVNIPTIKKQVSKVDIEQALTLVKENIDSLPMARNFLQQPLSAYAAWFCLTIFEVLGIHVVPSCLEP